MKVVSEITVRPSVGSAAAAEWRFYGLLGDGFRLTPDLRLRFVHDQYATAMAAVAKGLAQAEGFVVVTGPPGIGKTTLARDLLSEQRAQGRLCAEVINTQVEADDLLRLAAFGFGLATDYPNKASLLTALQQRLSQRHQTGRPAILLVDDAQNLNVEALEELRLLSNLTADGGALLQILLFGQSGLWRQLEQPAAQQLLQHLVCTHEIKPLDASQTRDYVAYRLRGVGWSGRPSISAQALRLIHADTAGIPRHVNRLLSQLLQLGLISQRLNLDADEVEQVATQLRDAHLLPAAENAAELLTPPPANSTSELTALDAAAAAALDNPLDAHQPDPPAAGAGFTLGAIPAALAPATALAAAKRHAQQLARQLRAALGPARLHADRQRAAARLTAQRGVTALREMFRTAVTRIKGYASPVERPGRRLAIHPYRAIARASRRLRRRWRRSTWDWSVAPAAFATLMALGMLATAAYVALSPADGQPPVVVQQPPTQPASQPRTTSPAAAETGHGRPQRAAAVVPPSATSASDATADAPLVVRLPSPRPLDLLPQDSAALVAAPDTTGPDGFVALHSGLATPAAPLFTGSASSGQLTQPHSGEALDQVTDAATAHPLTSISLDDLPATAAGPGGGEASAADPPDSPTKAASVATVGVPKPTDPPAAAADQPPLTAPLLAKADTAMAEYRYTLPSGNNAHAYYTAVLAHDPDNGHARAGLAEISRRYWQMSRNKLDSEDLEAADRLVQRGLRADPDHPRLLALAEEIALRFSAAIAVSEPAPPEPVLTEVEEPPPATPQTEGFWARLKNRLSADSTAEDSVSPFFR